jgi:hypothetical protein
MNIPAPKIKPGDVAWILEGGKAVQREVTWVEVTHRLSPEETKTSVHYFFNKYLPLLREDCVFETKQELLASL